MCVRYRPPGFEQARSMDLRGLWSQLDAADAAPVHARARGSGGPILRAVRGASDGYELVSGLWRMLPQPPAGSAATDWPTYNARCETIDSKRTFAKAWANGQRCLIPAVWWLEPCWETGANVWWRFGPSDGGIGALAGIWREWVDASTGEVVTGYAMITCNADDHPLMRRMHRPDPKRAPHLQDKRSVVLLEPADWERWLVLPAPEAMALVTAPALEALSAEPITADE